MATRQDQWPLYELANYDNSGKLVDLCTSLLTEHDENDDKTRDEQSLGRRKKNEGRKLGASCATTTGYQTLDEHKQQQQHQAAETNDQDRRRTGSTIDKQQQQGERLRHSNKSHPDTGGRRLLWWHLIEPVTYGGNLNANGREEADGAPCEPSRGGHCDFESAARARLLRLCSELCRLVGPFLVRDSLELASEPAAARKTISPPLHAGRLATTTHAARLKRLSWRRRPARIEPSSSSSARAVNLAKRSDTFSVSDGGESVARRRECSNETSARVGTQLEKWLTGGSEMTTGANTMLAGEWSRAASKRGKYGESLVHLLLIQHTNEHLIVLLALLHLAPNLVFDVIESDKFKHLNCLHLTIAQGNAQLLAHLLRLARRLGAGDPQRFRCFVEQRISGSLFRPPGDGRGPQVAMVQHHLEGASEKFWCDQLEHWPSANGREHLILLDRIARGDANRKCRESSRDSQVYLGQTPLAWSVSFESKEMFELLAGPAGGAQVAAGDELANNCLHQLVINNQLNWTRFLVKFDQRLATAVNHLRLTPFLLACHLGRAELLGELLELSAVEFWTYSSVKCCAYPLESLDSIVAGGRSQGDPTCRSAVSVILESSRSSDEQKSALLSTGVIKKLLEEKWKVFARRLFYRDLLLTLAQLLLLTIAFYLRPARINLDYLQELRQISSLGSTRSSNDADRLPAGILDKFLQVAHKQQLLRNACELIVVMVALSKVRQFLLEWARYRNLSLQFTYNPLVANLVLANTLLVLCLPLRLIGLVLRVETAVSRSQQGDIQLERASAILHQLDRLEDIALILASPLLWSSLLFFVAAFYVTGPFVAMINYMLMRDLKQFSLIYLIFLYSFAQSIFFINYQQTAGESNGSMPDNNQPVVGQIGANRTLTEVDHIREDELTLLTDWLLHLATKYLELWLQLFKMTLGVYEFQPYRHSLQSRLLLTLFLHLIPILFNMLIAMMNNTYSQVIAQSERAWSFQWACTLFALERRLNDQEKELYLREYAINLASSISESANGEDENATGALKDDGEGRPPFVPGLMIIKRTDCTRAELKRRLVGHWRRSTRRILEELKRNAGGQRGERAPPAGPWTNSRQFNF